MQREQNLLVHQSLVDKPQFIQDSKLSRQLPLSIIPLPFASRHQAPLQNSLSSFKRQLTLAVVIWAESKFNITEGGLGVREQ